MTLTWQALDTIASRHGPSFYLLDLQRMQGNIASLLGAYRQHYPKTTVAYSYKTNYTPAICQLVDSLGGYAEVVSGLEFDLARALGVPGSRIIFNGPAKTSVDIERAGLSGATVNLDSLREVREVLAIARDHPQHTFRVGLRANLGADPGAPPSRFGLPASQLRAAAAQLRAQQNCQLVCLHHHTSGGNGIVAALSTRTGKLLDLAVELFGSAGPDLLDLGGGLLGPMDPVLRAQFPFTPPSFPQYAEAVAAQISARFPGGAGPELVLEPGTAVVADTMSFIAPVVDIKELSGRFVAVIDGSVLNVKPTRHSKQMPVVIHRPPTRSEMGHPGRPVDLVGNTCMEHDILAQDHPGPIEVGDYAVFSSVGAYTVVMSPPFIHPAPPILAFGANGDIQVLRRRGELADIVAGFLLKSG